jgi:asparaginyl-tRNA synthetase
MDRIRIAPILSSGRPDQAVSVGGWVRSKRESKSIAFLVLNDGSTQDNLQVVVEPDSPAHSLLARCQTGAAVHIKGVLRPSPGKGQALELVAHDLHVFGEADPDKYPLQKKGHTLEFLRDIGHLRARTNTFGAVFRMRHHLAQAVHEFFGSRGFYWIHTPILTASDCEGAGEMFTVTNFDLSKPLPKTPTGQVDYSQDFFGKQARLTVSGQLEGEFMAMALGQVYTFGPTFRAENSNTTRHLAEFWMIEPEVAFADLTSNAQLAEDFIRAMCQSVLKTCPLELEFFGKHYQAMSMKEIEALGQATFSRMTYTEAVSLLEKAPVKFEFPVKWGLDLQSEHERYLTDTVIKGPVIVTDYPKGIKAFYMRRNDDDKTVAAMDVLVPRIGEIIGGSQREDRLPLLEERMREAHLPVEDLQWYLDLRRFGSAPHAGFGLGFERLVQYLSGMANIRDVIPCPRVPQKIDF